MYTEITSSTSPIRIANQANAKWSKVKTPQRYFYGGSYTSPTPKEYILQKLGLHISIALTLHVRDVKMGKFDIPTDPLGNDFDPALHTTVPPTVPPTDPGGGPSSTSNSITIP